MKTKKVKVLKPEELSLLLGGVNAGDSAGSTTTDVTSELASGGTTTDTDVALR